MKTITWNVNCRVPLQPDQAHRIADLGVDVVALQEITARTLPLWRDVFEHQGFEVVDSLTVSPEPGVLTGRRRYGEIIASRHPITALDPADFKVPWPERILSAVIELPCGPIEVHNVHLPADASDRTEGTATKIETFEGIADRLSRPCGIHRLLCGDFNSPKEEYADGTVVCWGGRRGKDGVVRPAPRSKRRQRKHRAEESVILGLASFDLGDAFRAVHGYEKAAYSYATHHQGRTFPRRFDHVFASESLQPSVAAYLVDCLEAGLSDHAPLVVTFDPRPLHVPAE